MRTLSLLVLVMMVVGCGSEVNNYYYTDSGQDSDGSAQDSDNQDDSEKKICVTDGSDVEKCFMENQCVFNSDEQYWVCTDDEIQICTKTPMQAYPIVCMASNMCKISEDRSFVCNYLWGNECFNQPCGEFTVNQNCVKCNPKGGAPYEDLVCSKMKDGSNECLNWCQKYDMLEKQMWEEACVGLESTCLNCNCWMRGMQPNHKTNKCEEFVPTGLCQFEPGNVLGGKFRYESLVKTYEQGDVESRRIDCINSEH